MGNSFCDITEPDDRDFNRIKSLNFNIIATLLGWHKVEPQPGVFDFSYYDKFVSLAEKHDMRILFWLFPDWAPLWFTDMYPDCSWIRSDGLQAGGSCFNHPKYREHVRRFIENVVLRYKDRQALLAWDPCGEPYLRLDFMNAPEFPSHDGLYCYCQYTTVEFRQWLKKKYGCLEALNRAWRTLYTDWEQVKMPRFIIQYFPGWGIDGRLFMFDNNTDYQRFKIEVVRRLDPNHPVLAHMVHDGDSAISAVDLWGIAKHVDIYGLSLYPYWIQLSAGFLEASLPAMAVDKVRSASGGKSTWCTEKQTGPNVLNLTYRTNPPLPEDLWIWGWQAVAHGIKGISYYMWRPTPSGLEETGHGLANLNGSINERCREIARFGAVLHKYAHLFINSNPVPAEVAIYHSPRAKVIAYGEGNENLYTQSERGLYRALWRANIPVDFIANEQIISGGLSKYKVLYMPFAFTISREEGQRIREFVENGGAAFSEIWCAQKDEHGEVYREQPFAAIPGAGLDKVFHCRESWTEVKETSLKGRIPIKMVSESEAARSLPVGSELSGYACAEIVDLLEGGVAIAEFESGKPAIVIGKYGGGRTVYACSFLCNAFDKYLDVNNQKLFVDFAKWAGVQPPISISDAPEDCMIEARLLKNDQKRVLILLNHNIDREVTPEFSFNIPFQPKKATDLVTDSRVTYRTKNGRVALQLHLRPKSGTVILFSA